jgi:hypothetical protein
VQVEQRRARRIADEEREHQPLARRQHAAPSWQDEVADRKEEQHGPEAGARGGRPGQAHAVEDRGYAQRAATDQEALDHRAASIAIAA